MLASLSCLSVLISDRRIEISDGSTVSEGDVKAMIGGVKI